MTNLSSKFTKDSERMLLQARCIARHYRQQVITAEYLLLGLLNLTSSQTKQMLAELKVNPAAIKTRLAPTSEWLRTRSNFRFGGADVSA